MPPLESTLQVHVSAPPQPVRSSIPLRQSHPAQRLDEIEALVTEQVADIRAGGPNDPATSIGPVVSLKQWQRVQRYIQIGIEEGAHLLVGGPGLPDGIDAG